MHIISLKKKGVKCLVSFASHQYELSEDLSKKLNLIVSRECSVIKPLRELHLYRKILKCWLDAAFNPVEHSVLNKGFPWNTCLHCVWKNYLLTIWQLLSPSLMSLTSHASRSRSVIVLQDTTLEEIWRRCRANTWCQPSVVHAAFYVTHLH